MPLNQTFDTIDTRNKWNHLIVWKSSDLFKNIADKMCLEIIYLMYMYKRDLTLNDLQWLICHKS